MNYHFVGNRHYLYTTTDLLGLPTIYTGGGEAGLTTTTGLARVTMTGAGDTTTILTGGGGGGGETTTTLTGRGGGQ